MKAGPGLRKEPVDKTSDIPHLLLFGPVFDPSLQGELAMTPLGSRLLTAASARSLEGPVAAAKPVLGGATTASAAQSVNVVVTLQSGRPQLLVATTLACSSVGCPDDTAHRLPSDVMEIAPQVVSARAVGTTGPASMVSTAAPAAQTATGVRKLVLIKAVLVSQPALRLLWKVAGVDAPPLGGGSRLGDVALRAEHRAAGILVHGILFCFLFRGAGVPEILVPVFDDCAARGALKVINTLHVGLF